MAMDVIIPYVIWITLLAWLMDLALRQLHKPVSRGRKEAGHEFYRHQQYLAGVRRPRGAGAHQFAGERGRVLFDGRRVRLREIDLFTPAARPGTDPGSITLDGQPLAAEPDRSRGVVFQRYSVFPHLNVLDNVAIGLELPASPLLGRLFGAKRAARERAQQMLEKVGLGHALDKYPAQLSGGMQQRLAIAQAFVMQPRVCCLMNLSARWIPVFAKICTPAAPAVERNADDGLYGHPRLAEGFNLGTRLLVFDKVRIDPQAPNAYGARITYDIRSMSARCRS
jgi:NitT/TauT family transport system ATP-binding protein